MEVIFELRKVDFGGLNGQFDVKKVNFRGLLAKIDLFGAYLGFENPLTTLRYVGGIYDHFQDPLMTHFHHLCHGNCALKCIEENFEIIKIDYGGL